jgi:ribosomal protein S1
MSYITDIGQSSPPKTRIKTMIIQISEKEFFTKSGNTELTLVHNDMYGWHVYANNPATRAYKSLGFKQLGSIANVEKTYKAFRGISTLIAQ